MLQYSRIARSENSFLDKFEPSAYFRFMALYVIATPIGDDEDISLRARRILGEAELIIGEEAKVTRRLLKRLDLPIKPIELLNEHSTLEDIKELVQVCKRHDKVALISDCGTPGFCDPGAELVQLCRQHNVPVRSIPGPSSLMTFLSISGRRLPTFYFRGFLPAQNEIRKIEIDRLKTITDPIILMDTPYRLKKLLTELNESMPQSHLVLGMNLSKENEVVLEGTAGAVLKNLVEDKAEFILLLQPSKRTPHPTQAKTQKPQPKSSARKKRRIRTSRRK